MPQQDDPRPGHAATTAYAELHCLSDFSFQRGASSARELFERAASLDYRALAITDECSLAGIVRAWEASKSSGVPLIVGSELRLEDGTTLVLLVEDATGYAGLCRLITLARRRGAKGAYRLSRADLQALEPGLLVLWVPDASCLPSRRAALASGEVVALPRQSAEVIPLHRARSGATADAAATVPDDAVPALAATAAWLAEAFAGRAWIAVELHRGPADAADLAVLQALGQRHGLPLVAAGGAHMHHRRRRALQDAMTAIRLGCPLSEAGQALFPNGERHLRSPRALAAIYPAALCEETLRIAARCRFRLGNDLHYDYPHELVPAGLSAAAHLRALTEAGARARWPQGVPGAVRALLEKELLLIAECGYEHFFLTVADIVAWARAQTPPILCQGRGSAANSAVCYCLGITSVDPAGGNLRFERFVSRERGEPPDIDVDFEHERREDVLQYVFAKYGRDRAALAATVITWQPKSAVRALGAALGLARDQQDALARVFARGNQGAPLPALLRERGIDPDHPAVDRLLALAADLVDRPRHLSQHVGGFVISERPLHTLVPVENAAMAGRTVIQWDKDDLDSMGLLKVDCLALGMLTCLRKSFDLLRRHDGVDLTLASVPQDDRATYAMIARADTVGTFQIESRAQMSMLPRLKPACFYDLVIQVAIVRPGPIQGGMVHPYLRRRSGAERVHYPKPELRPVLERTLGVPLFQEQVMHLLQVAADFTPGEADQLRRSMAAWKRHGGLEHFEPRIHEGMRRRGYSPDYAAAIFEQIKGFGSYGFPESHATGFAQIAYVSAWLKCHHPAAYACALLNAQPMGFYAPAQIIQDLRRHGVEVRPVDVTASAWDCTLEPGGHDGRHALRLGLRQIVGLGADVAERIVLARQTGPFRDVADLARRARLARGERDRLAAAGALHGLSGHRHRAHWDSAGAEPPPALLYAAPLPDAAVALPAPSLREDVLHDYASQGYSLLGHPVGLVRARLRARGVLDSNALAAAAGGRGVHVAGLVTVRQAPGTAHGTVFVTLEDEHGAMNIIVWPDVAARWRRPLLDAVLLGVIGELQARDGVRHVVAQRLVDHSALLSELASQSRDFH